MSKYKDMVKSRLPGERSSPSTGQKQGIRGSVGTMLGRNKEDIHERAANHNSVPIERLRDPSSFAPPPKRTGTGLAPAPPPSAAKRKVAAAPSKWQDPRGPAVAAPERITMDPAVEEWYAQNNPEVLRDHQNGQPAVGASGQRLIEGPQAGGQEAASAAPKQYRANTTGLSTDHLPKPPGRRDGADGRSPPSYDAATAASPASPALPARSSPSLPPRLPARMGNRSPPKQEAAANTTNGGLNQGAMNRLGAAGVTVPSLGIGKPVSSTTSAPSPPPPPRQGGGPPVQVTALQNRFAKMSTPSSESGAAASAQSEGTTWQQKQAALTTASQFKKDPSSVSLSDAKSAAGTMNNFRQRHGDQVSAGWNKANQLNRQYGISEKMGGIASQGNDGNAASAGTAAATPASLITAAAGKKKPPPPPKKKPGLAGTVADSEGPPPIPMSTRPNF